MLRSLIMITLMLLQSPAIGQQRADAAFDQADFAAAYNRKDVDAMAAAFAEGAIRVTPSGIFRGRDEIRKSFDDALKLGLHDYAVRRSDTRTVGDVQLNTGEWQAKLGEQPFHGYYTSILGKENGQIKILEETVTLAAPER